MRIIFNTKKNIFTSNYNKFLIMECYIDNNIIAEREF